MIRLEVIGLETIGLKMIGLNRVRKYRVRNDSGLEMIGSRTKSPFLNF